MLNTTLASEIFKAFADPTRLRILALLQQGELCVCHIVEVLGESQPKVSRHLATLRRAGLVRARTEGRWKHYALPEDPEDLEAHLLRCVPACLSQVDPIRGDLRRLERLLEAACCGNEAEAPPPRREER